MDSNNPNYGRNPSKKNQEKKSSNNQSVQIQYQNPPFSQNTPNYSYYIPQNIPNSSYYVSPNTQNS